MATQPGATSRQCYKCGQTNPAQAFCGICGSPLALDEFIRAKVDSQLTDAIRDRDVLETESSIKVFEKALGWMKLLFWVATVALAIVGVVVGYQAWDFTKGIEKAKQSVTEAARKSADDISGVSSNLSRTFQRPLMPPRLTSKLLLITPTGNRSLRKHRRLNRKRIFRNRLNHSVPTWMHRDTNCRPRPSFSLR